MGTFQKQGELTRGLRQLFPSAIVTWAGFIYVSTIVEIARRALAASPITIATGDTIDTVALTCIITTATWIWLRGGNDRPPLVLRIIAGIVWVGLSVIITQTVRSFFAGHSFMQFFVYVLVGPYSLQSGLTWDVFLFVQLIAPSVVGELCALPARTVGTRTLQSH